MEFKLETVGEVRRWASAMADASLFASSDQLRPVLTNVLVELNPSSPAGKPGEVAMVATDSYILGRVSFDQGSEANPMPPERLKVLVGAKPLAELAKRLVKETATNFHGKPILLEVDDTGLTVTASSWNQCLPATPAEFPNHEQLTPVGEPEAFTAGWGINPIQFAVLAKLTLGGPAAKRGKACGPIITLESYGSKPSVIRSSVRDGCEFFGLIMPVRLPGK